jgi:hypothetical protein
MMGAVGVAALLAACSDSTDVATGPRYLSSAPTTSACNITTTKADARAYFPNGVQTTVQALIKTMGDQFTAGNTAGATNTGFDIMKFIADAHRNGTAAGTAQDGSNLTNDLIGCMAVGVIPPIELRIAESAHFGEIQTFQFILRRMSHDLLDVFHLIRIFALDAGKAFCLHNSFQVKHQRVIAALSGKIDK